MRITEGALVRQFSIAFDIPLDGVLAWINAYVNHPGDFHFQTEKTEAERMKSIKAYITMRINDTSNERIRASIAAEKLESE